MTLRPPDLILVMTDQQRYDQVGYWPGPGPETPNIDRLAASGVTFTSAYSSSTTCVPSRVSLLTGLFPHRAQVGETGAVSEGWWTLARALRAVGYQTALVGKMHFWPIRADHGFDHLRTCEHLAAYGRDPRDLDQYDHYHDWLAERGLPDWRLTPEGMVDGPYHGDPATHPTSWVLEETLAFLARRDPSRPMLLVVSFPHPHPPINPPEPYASRYDPAAPLVDPDGASLNDFLPHSFRVEMAQADHPQRRVDPANLPQYQASLARTWGLVSQIDDAVGVLVDHLDLDRSLLWFTSDHGDFGARRGLIRKVPWIPFDDLAKVPCFAAGGLVAGRGDGQLSIGRVEDAPVQSFDVAATFAALGGAEVDLDLLDAKDLSGYLADADAVGDPDRVVGTSVHIRFPMVRRGPHKYIADRGWRSSVLFDVVQDPDERWDVTSLDTDGVIARSLATEVERMAQPGQAPLPVIEG